MDGRWAMNDLPIIVMSAGACMVGAGVWMLVRAHVAACRDYARDIERRLNWKAPGK